MHKIIQFLKDHPHCTEPFCTTDGGLMGLWLDTMRWIEQDHPDLDTLFASLTPTDLLVVRDWPDYLGRMVGIAIKDHKKHAIFLAWKRNFGIDPDYDIFGVGLALPGSFQPENDIVWVTHLSHHLEQGSNEKALRSLVNFIGDHAKSFPELIERLDTVKNARIKAEEVESTLKAERELAIKQKGERQRQYRADCEAYFASVPYASDPLQRLMFLQKKSPYPLDEAPARLAVIPDSYLTRLTSMDLTRLIRVLTDKANCENPGPWRNLRSQLYRARQAVYNRERGFSS